MSASQNELVTTLTGSARQAVEWVIHNGDPFVHTEFDGLNTFTFFGTKYKAFELVRWLELLTRAIGRSSPITARAHALSLSYAVPGSDVQYWIANYDYLQFLPLPGPFTLALIGDFAYGEDIGDTTSIPPYRQFFAGGPDSVRGYRESRLGPKDSFGNPYGSNLKVVGRAEILFPVPEKWKTYQRASASSSTSATSFSTGHVSFTGKDGVTPVEYKIRV